MKRLWLIEFLHRTGLTNLSNQEVDEYMAKVLGAGATFPSSGAATNAAAPLDEQVRVQDHAIQEFQFTTTELMLRLKLRDTVLITCLAVITATYIVALTDFVDVRVLLIVPLLAFAGAVIVSHHHDSVGGLVQHFSDDVLPYMRQGPPHWNESFARARINQREMTFRFFAHTTSLGLPAIGALFLADHGLSSSQLLLWAWRLGWVCVGAIVWITAESGYWRMRDSVTVKARAKAKLLVLKSRNQDSA